MKTVTVVSEDRVGLLADISYILGKSNVNIEGLFVDVIGGKAVISLEVRDPRKASDILARNSFKTTSQDAIIIKVANNYMEKITEILEGEKVQVKEFSRISSDANDGIFAVKVDKPRKAVKILDPFLLGNSPNPTYY